MWNVAILIYPLRPRHSFIAGASAVPQSVSWLASLDDFSVLIGMGDHVCGMHPRVGPPALEQASSPLKVDPSELRDADFHTARPARDTIRLARSVRLLSCSFRNSEARRSIPETAISQPRSNMLLADHARAA